MARKYTKKNVDYWNNLKNPVAESEVVPKKAQHSYELNASFDESEHYTSTAACGGGDLGGGTSYRNQAAPTVIDGLRYKNIRQGIVPFWGSRDGYYSVGDAISLVYQAYFNVSIIRNSITLLQDFSVSPLKVVTTNQTVKRFFENWFNVIQLDNFMSQFFLEYYRSGNVFIYKFNGKVPDMKFDMLKTALGAKSNEIPVRYIILNPMQVYLQLGPTYNYNFSRMLSTYEVERLRNPKTVEDKEVLKSFPKAVQDQIKNYAATPYVYAPLDTERLYYVFNRKQDYEPLAIPPIFPVLNDVELKLEMKRMDLSLVRMMEQVVLLVTMGDKADEWNAGFNPKNLDVLRNIFQNQTIGRVLVSDYTTKLEWKIPDLKQLLGQEKYNRVDLDIKEGLQYMFFGDEKFANASIKAKVFIQGLKEGRRAFLDNFLRPEVKKLCQKMNFKVIPDLEFEDINIEDPSSINRIYYQMAQLGLLTSDELNKAIETGILPSKDESVENQQEYKKLRDKGLYAPMLGKPDDSMGRPSGTGSPKSSSKTSPIGTTKAGISVDKIVAAIPAMHEIEDKVVEALKKKYKVDELDATQQPDSTGIKKTPQADVARLIAQSIILNEPEDQWKKSVASYMKNPKNIPEDIGRKLDEIAAEYNTNPWESIVLYRSQIES